MQYVLATRYSRNWFYISLFCIVFSLIYELCSFGVISNHMIFLFAYPLLLGVLPCMIMKGNMGRLYNDGVLLLSAASLLNGILEIYGTKSSYTIVLVILGILLMTGQLFINRTKRKKRNERKQK